MNNEDKPGCLGRMLCALGLSPRRREPEALPYHVRDDFLSSTELSFYHVLRTAVDERAVICPKVSLGDLFFTKSGDYRINTSYNNRIARKHVDFLLCDCQSMEPLVGIELDDSSHGRAARHRRDDFVDRVFAAAGLPLYRQRAQLNYDTRDLVSALQSVLSKAQQSAGQGSAGPSPVPAPDMGEARPACPRCGQPMVLRTVQRDGPRKGSQFWGCPNYPRCRGIRDLVPKSRE